MICPECKETSLKTVVQYGGVELDRCPDCQGLWFDGGELEEILGTSATADMSELPAEAQTAARICPRCGTELYKFQYPSTRVTVDMCAECNGMWLDRGELMQLANSLQETGKKIPCYGYRPGEQTCFLIEKTQHTNSSTEYRQYCIDTLELEVDKGNYMQLTGRQLAINKQHEAKRQVHIDKKGRFYDCEANHGFVGAAGMGENPVAVSHIYGAYYFPWLPDEPLEPDTRWDIEFRAGSFPEAQLQAGFEMEAHFTVVNISQHRGRNCAEIRFTYEGNRRESENRIQIHGRGTWFFDLDTRMDLMLEKRTVSSPIGNTNDDDNTEHMVRRVLSEQTLGKVGK